MATDTGKNAPLLKNKKNKIDTGIIGEDRISELPDSLLIHILSLFPETKDTFVTSTLSKRWQYLWTSLDSFCFCSKECFCLVSELAEYGDRFFSFVDYALSHYNCSKIKKLKLVICYLPTSYGSKLDRCISMAIEKKVEHVVYWHEGGCHALPLPLRYCPSLITLDLKHCYLGKAHWESLKSLTLRYCQPLGYKDVDALLSKYPVLETLQFFSTVMGFNSLVIKSSNLKRLHLDSIHMENYPRYKDLEVFAPYIQHLEITGKMRCYKFRLLNVSSVLTARLTFQIICRSYDDEVIWALVEDCLQNLSSATELTFGTWFMEVMLQFERRPLPKLKSKFLTLDLYLKSFYSNGAIILLQALPFLETLNITMSTEQLSSRSLVLGYLSNIHLLPSFSLPNLKNVKVTGRLDGFICLKELLQQENDELSHFSEFLLKNARDLEKFIIVPRKNKCMTCSMNCVSRYLFELAEKLLVCPRSSTKALIVFQ